MSATISISVQRPTQRRVLRLSPLLRFSLATARPDPDGKPTLLPTKIPAGCVGKGFKCHNLTRWFVSDGINTVCICASCAERLWDMYDALTFHVERI